MLTFWSRAMLLPTLVPSWIPDSFGKSIISLTRRLFSQSARGNRSVTSLLREFYLKTHPDMFGSYPDARRINEHSLKALAQHLENLQSGRLDSGGLTPLTFYLKSKSAHGKTSFRVIVTSLKNTSVNDNIYHLLNACYRLKGFPPLEKALHLLAPAHSRPRHGPKDTLSRSTLYVPIGAALARRARRQPVPSLEEFVNKNILKAAEKSALAIHRRRVNRESSKAVKTLLGLRAVTNESSWSDAHSTILYKWLEDIAKNDRLRSSLEGLDVVFSQAGSDVDKHGRLLLSVRDQRADWVAFLQEVDIDEARVLNEQHRLVGTMESQLGHVARGMNVMTHSKNVAAYTALLKRLLDNTAHLIAVDSGFLNDTVLHATDSTELALEHTTGVVQMPLDTDPSALISFLRTYGPLAAHQRRVLQERRTALETLRQTAASRLHVERITWAPEMGREEVLGCLQRLMMLPPGYEILQGASIHIAREYGLRDDGAFSIPSDFQSDALPPGT